MLKALSVTSCLVLAASALQADTVLGDGTFQPIPAQLRLGGAYWDNPAFDTSQMNVGYFLTGTGAFPAACGTNALCSNYYSLLGVAGNYYSAGLGTLADAPNDFSFLRNSAAVQITLLGQYSPNNTAGNGYSGNMPTTIGYYDASATTTSAAMASEIPLWGAGTIPGSVGTSVYASRYSDYGFYETVCTATAFTNGTYQCVATATYFSNSSLNPAGQTNQQHFALFGSLFSNSGTYYIGFEDSQNPQATGDYNDVIIRLSNNFGSGGTTGGGGGGGGPSPIPEPRTFSLIGIGLLGVTFAAWSRRGR
jgi:hypothetical protein